MRHVLSVTDDADDADDTDDADADDRRKLCRHNEIFFDKKSHKKARGAVSHAVKLAISYHCLVKTEQGNPRNSWHHPWAMPGKPGISHVYVVIREIVPEKVKSEWPAR